MAQTLQLFNEQETAEALKSATNTIANQRHVPALRDSILNSRDSIDAALRQIFVTKQEETEIQKARSLMGNSVATVPDEDMEVYLAEIHYLLDNWMDEFERQIYDGVTLKQLLQE